jgi:hypothetical protein
MEYGLQAIIELENNMACAALEGVVKANILNAW